MGHKYRKISRTVDVLYSISLVLGHGLYTIYMHIAKRRFIAHRGLYVKFLHGWIYLTCLFT